MRAIKPYSEELNELFDKPARDEAKLLLQEKFDISNVVDHPNKKSVDLIATLDDGSFFYVEVEIRASWKGQSFPFSTVNLPKRKGRYLHCLDSNIYYCIFNEALDAAIWFSGDVLKGSSIIEKTTKYSSGVPEEFYNIRTSDVEFFKKE